MRFVYLARLFESLLIRRVDHIDENIGVIKIVLPKLPNLPLTSNVPYIEFDAGGLHSFDVKPLFKVRASNVRKSKVHTCVGVM